ncbi:hypothetical protein ACHAL6_05605, partial [Proteiniclasticum sp. C24MP]|uniref:hypothetical protein n=1 Tax=Proteiniclasticum sp. C24MP TaxID=3374101 RepID=UPI003755185F
MKVKKVVSLMLVLLLFSSFLFSNSKVYANTETIVTNSAELIEALSNPEISAVGFGDDIITNEIPNIEVNGDQKRINGNGFSWNISSENETNVNFNLRIDLLSDLNIISGDTLNLNYFYGGNISNIEAHDTIVQSSGTITMIGGSYKGVIIDNGNGSSVSGVKVNGTGIKV